MAIFIKKLERKVKTGLSLTKGSSILEPPFPLDPIAPGWKVIKQNNFPRFRNVICFCVFLVFFCVLSRKDAGWLQHLAKLIKLKVEMKHHDLYFSCIVETWREFYMNMRDNQIIENTLWDFFTQIKSIILREQYWLWSNGYLGFDNGNSETLFLDCLAKDIMVDNGKIWWKLSVSV